MARDFNGSTQTAWSTFPSIVGAKSISLWIYPDTTTAGMRFASFNATGSNLYISNGGTGDINATFVFSGTDLTRRSSTFPVNIGAWNHIAILHSGSTLITQLYMYVNGTEVAYAAGVNATGTETATNSVYFGSYLGSSLWFNGKIAEFAYWNTMLEVAQIVGLSRGYSPLLFKPQSLISYHQLIGRTSPEIDLVGGYGMTLANAPTAAAHPRIIYPSNHQAGLHFTPASAASPYMTTSPGLWGPL